MEQEAQEGREEAQSRARDLLAETQRLEAHVSDLETRKRAPLYQKKQEEELRAAVEKAAEAELRATDAELKYKEAKVGLGLMAKGVFIQFLP
jgi:centromeric protein E